MTQVPVDIEETRRAHLARAVMGILHAWGLESRDQMLLLGFDQKTRPRALARFRNGEAFPEDEALLARARHIVAIDRATQTMYPLANEVGHYWVSTENAYFNGRTPLEVMLEGGEPAMLAVLEHLNGTGAWS